jgi:hypothetical protein
LRERTKPDEDIGLHLPKTPNSKLQTPNSKLQTGFTR